MRYDDILKGVALYILAFGMILLLMLSCKTAEQHFEKFQKKGGKIECKGDTVIREVTTTIKGKDGRIDTLIEKVPVIEYMTRYETKWKYKLKRDSIEVVKYDIKWKTKETIKIKRNSRKSNVLLWFLLGAATPVALYLLLKK